MVETRVVMKDLMKADLMVGPMVLLTADSMVDGMVM